MAKHLEIPEEKKIELLSNPFTERVTDFQVIFSLAFKEFVIANIYKPGMNSVKVFELAGYRHDIFSYEFKQRVVLRIKKEAASPQGLKAPAVIHPRKPRKKHTDKEFEELQERIELLEQQIDFLKKSQLLKKQTRAARMNSSG